MAQKLGISVNAMKKNDMDRPLTTAEIKALLDEAPEWLTAARKQHAEQRAGAADAPAAERPAHGTAVGPSVAHRATETDED